MYFQYISHFKLQVISQRPRSSCSLYMNKDKNDTKSDDEFDDDGQIRYPDSHQNHSFVAVSHMSNSLPANGSLVTIPYSQHPTNCNMTQTTVKNDQYHPKTSRQTSTSTKSEANNGLMALNDMYGGVFGNLVTFTAQTAGCDFLPLDPIQREIEVREKFWGDILERAVSSHNLKTNLLPHASYETNSKPTPTNSFSGFCNKEQKLFSSSPLLATNKFQKY